MKRKKKKVLVTKRKVASPPIVKEPFLCMKCQDEIKPERLKLIPGTVLCAGCQSAEDLQFIPTIPRKWVANIGE